MTDEEAQRLRRENEYLRVRCAQLQDDVTDLSGQLERQRQQLEHTRGRGAIGSPNPLSGGQ